MFQQCRAVAIALVGRIDTDHRQIPVRLGRMISIHLFEQRKYFCLIPLRNTILQQCIECFFIGMDPWWKPKRRGRVPVDQSAVPCSKAAPAKTLTK